MDRSLLQGHSLVKQPHIIDYEGRCWQAERGQEMGNGLNFDLKGGKENEKAYRYDFFSRGIRLGDDFR